MLNSNHSENNEERKISFKNLSIIYMHYVLYWNDEVLVLNFDGFSVVITLPDKYTKEFVCVATFVYNKSGKNEKKEYYIESIIQLNRWLDCIRKHTRLMYMLNSCRKVEEIPTVLMSESKYLIDKLDEIMS